jgi:hypothetical protein
MKKFYLVIEKMPEGSPNLDFDKLSRPFEYIVIVRFTSEEFPVGIESCLKRTPSIIG